MPVEVPVGVGLICRVADAVSVGVSVGVGLAVLVLESEGVAEEVHDWEPVGLAERVGLCVRVGVDVGVSEGVMVSVKVSVIVLEELKVGLIEKVGDMVEDATWVAAG